MPAKVSVSGNKDLNKNFQFCDACFDSNTSGLSKAWLRSICTLVSYMSPLFCFQFVAAWKGLYKNVMP